MALQKEWQAEHKEETLALAPTAEIAAIEPIVRMNGSSPRRSPLVDPGVDALHHLRAILHGEPDDERPDRRRLPPAGVDAVSQVAVRRVSLWPGGRCRRTAGEQRPDYNEEERTMKHASTAFDEPYPR